MMQPRRRKQKGEISRFALEKRTCIRYRHGPTVKDVKKRGSAKRGSEFRISRPHPRRRAREQKPLTAVVLGILPAQLHFILCFRFSVVIRGAMPLFAAKLHFRTLEEPRRKRHSCSSVRSRIH
eukprot:3825057-Rhodomonas_salina.2